ncbi:Phosphorylated carbohydrates phosphatase [Hordeum vulgare]|nr:Phosphorylated carbohydrates phosphatase [Hordeum vulgare]
MLARTGTPESEARAAHRERKQATEREAKQFARRHRRMPAKPDEDECLLTSVFRQSLMTVETNSRRLRRKNAQALRLAIEQSKREAKELAKEKTDSRR